MSTVRRSPWSFAALSLWLAQAALALAISAGLLFGAEIADRAWADGAHVTPEQAAMHAALLAEGFTHHHGAVHIPASEAVGRNGNGPALQSSAGGSIWGMPLLQAVDRALIGLDALACCSVPAEGEAQPVGADLVPRTPPP